MKVFVFNSHLCKILANNKDYKYIPRIIKYNESLKIRHKYWLQDFESIVKVEEVFYINDDIYYTVKDCITGRYAAISVSETSTNYELLVDYNEVLSTSEIVNTDIAYSGAEIRSWFFYNYSDKYENFLSYLDFYNDKHSINDSKVYYLYGDIEDNANNNKYVNCKVVLKKI